MSESFEPGRFAPNIMHFARVLRTAGLPVGPGKVLDAIRAVEAVGLAKRRDFYWTLHAVFVNRRDQRELFDQAFHIFWRKPDLLEKMMQLLLPSIDVGERPDQAEVARRIAEALASEQRTGQGEAPEDAEPPTVELDATLSFSEREILQHKDFEQMSAEEIGVAKPHPKIFLIACETLEVDPTEALYVGDSPVKDIDPAHEAGLTTVLRRGQGKHFAAVGQHEPDFLIDSFDELVTILEDQFGIEIA